LIELENQLNSDVSLKRFKRAIIKYRYLIYISTILAISAGVLYLKYQVSIYKGIGPSDLLRGDRGGLKKIHMGLLGIILNRLWEDWVGGWKGRELFGPLIPKNHFFNLIEHFREEKGLN